MRTRVRFYERDADAALQADLATAKTGSRKQKKERKNRDKKVRGTKKK